MSTIGERLAAAVRAARKDQNWTQAQLAEAIDGSVDGVGAIERGVHDASLETAGAMINALGIDAAHIFGGDDRRAVSARRLENEAALSSLAKHLDDTGLSLLLDVAAAIGKIHKAKKR